LRPDAFNTAGKCDVGQGVTIGKRPVLNAGYTAGNDYVWKADAIGKRPGINACDGAGYGDAGQVKEVKERVRPDCCDRQAIGRKRYGHLADKLIGIARDGNGIVGICCEKELGLHRHRHGQQ